MTPIFNEDSNIKEDRQLSHIDARSVTAYHYFLHANEKLRPMTAVASIQPVQVTLHRPPATCHQLVVAELHLAGAGTEQASYATSLPPDYLSSIAFSAPRQGFDQHGFNYLTCIRCRADGGTEADTLGWCIRLRGGENRWGRRG